MTALRAVNTQYVELDFLEGVQVVAAINARQDHFARLIGRTGDPDGGIGRALIHLIAAELRIRQAFDITQDDVPALPDIPLADDRHPALATYQDEGR